MKLSDDNNLLQPELPKEPRIHRFMFRSSLGPVLYTEIDINKRNETTMTEIVSTVSREETSKWEFEKQMLLQGEMQQWLDCVTERLARILNGH
jgi:hypothetical protein